MKWNRNSVALGFAHFSVDNYSCMYGAFLPFLHSRLGLSMSEAGLLGGALVFSSALLQPVYGMLADRHRHKAFSAAGPAVAAIFLSSLGLATDFWTLLVLLVLGGAGIASFHPQGAALTTHHAGDKHAYHMSLFVTMGTVGFALGPSYISWVIDTFGLNRSYWAAIPGVLVSLYLFKYGPAPAPRAAMQQEPPLRDSLRTYFRPLAFLYILVVLRATISSVLNAFLPLFFTQSGASPARANHLLTLFLLAGGLAGFAGGMIAERYGSRRIIALSFGLSLPLFVGFLWTSGPLSIFLGVAATACLLSTTPVNVVLAQKLIPHGASTISALMMGFAWGLGGLFVPVFGWMSDVTGFQSAFLLTALLTVPGFVVSLFLPKEIEASPRLAEIQASPFEAVTEDD